MLCVLCSRPLQEIRHLNSAIADCGHKKPDLSKEVAVTIESKSQPVRSPTLPYSTL